MHKFAHFLLTIQLFLENKCLFVKINFLMCNINSEIVMELYNSKHISNECELHYCFHTLLLLSKKF